MGLVTYDTILEEGGGPQSKPFTEIWDEWSDRHNVRINYTDGRLLQTLAMPTAHAALVVRGA